VKVTVHSHSCPILKTILEYISLESEMHVSSEFQYTFDLQIPVKICHSWQNKLL